MTSDQNDASAKPPCTRTTVGVFVDSLMSVFLSRGDADMSNLGAGMRRRVRRVTDVFRSMTYVIRPLFRGGRSAWKPGNHAIAREGPGRRDSGCPDEAHRAPACGVSTVICRLGMTAWAGVRPPLT